jgi:hypothetical protein
MKDRQTVAPTALIMYMFYGLVRTIINYVLASKEVTSKYR